MASLQFSLLCSCTAAGLNRPRLRFFSPSICFTKQGQNATPTHLHLRFQDTQRLQVRQRISPAFASNTNPSDKSKSNDSAAGPPLATILAGLLVFLVVCWIVGSVVLWLVGLIIQPPSIK